MTPAQLYARQPESEDSRLSSLHGFNFNHVPELDPATYPDMDPASRIVIRYFKNFEFDCRRFWLLAAVCIDGAPFMVIQNAGREGDDHVGRFVTDAGLYTKAAAYLASLSRPSDGKTTFVSPDEEVPGLTDFYGTSLDGSFRRY